MLHSPPTAGNVVRDGSIVFWERWRWWGRGPGGESLRNDVYTAAAYRGDKDKLRRLVQSEACSVSEPHGLGYYALQWVALNNRTAAARYIIEIALNMTTNEMANAMCYSYLRGPDGRFRNPYDDGCRKICSNFLISGYNEDIKYEEPPDHAEGIGMTHV